MNICKKHPHDEVLNNYMSFVPHASTVFNANATPFCPASVNHMNSYHSRRLNRSVMPYSPCAALDPDTASFSPTSSHFFYYDNFSENAVLNATPCAHDISTPGLSEIDLGDNNAHNLTDCSDDCDGCILNTEKNFDSTFLSQKYISGTNSTVCNFEEIGLLNTSPSMHDISTPALSQFSDNGDTNSITNISELSSLDSFLTNMEESKNEDSDPLSKYIK